MLSSVWNSDEPGGTTTRRGWIIGSLMGGLGFALQAPEPERSRADADSDADEARELVSIQARAKAAGLGGFRSSRTAHYLGIGDAPNGYRQQALKICAMLATAYEQHFRDKGFPVAFPPRRLTVIALAGKSSYAAFTGADPGPVGGHYDLDTNRLVIFDFRASRAELAANAERVNTLTLVHEATHQLTFNTGLLDRRGDVPVCISEGLAMYGEVWRHLGRSDLGQLNVPRLQVIAESRRQAISWFPLRRLFVADDLLTDEQTRQLANAESWLLVYYLLRNRATLPRLRHYLDALRARADAAHRLADVRAHLGEPDRLDRDLRNFAARLLGK
jgi:hypothetical protein